MKKKMIPRLLIFLIVGVIFFDQISAALAQTQVEVGPTFTGTDQATIGACVTAALSGSFPVDFFAKAIPPAQLTPPTLTLFDNSRSLPELIQIWSSIKPGVFIVLMYTAIIRL